MLAKSLTAHGEVPAGIPALGRDGFIIVKQKIKI
jgi:hypothetical protein